jgi:hypothetical protein
MKIGVKKPIPQWVKAKMPCGIERLNTLNCRYYGIIGLSRKVRDWYEGMFMEAWIYDWYEAEYVLDLQEGVWWSTGIDGGQSARKLEEERALRKAVA